MSKVNDYLRRAVDRYSHWCPACQEMHSLSDSWIFDGNLEKPTFNPSFRHTGVKKVFAGTRWTGEWVRDAKGEPVPYVCHYHLHGGILKFCGDCTHELAGKEVPLPKLPLDEDC